MITSSPRLSHRDIEAAFLTACNAELKALKPGNVHVFAGGHDMAFEHFEKSAAAAAAIIADAKLSVGARIKQAVAASMDAAGCNTNLGIILLCAPLAAAFDQEFNATDPQQRLTAVLDRLTGQDAEDVFAAIRLANPGGLGEADQFDVRDPPPAANLLDAMRLAADRDRIANAYVTGFTDVFTHHLPTYKQALGVRRTSGTTDSVAITMLHMQILQDFPDSHIGRKFGAKVARDVQRRAADLRPVWYPDENGATLQAADPKLLAFDQDLKNQGLNPGTTADFVVATVFAEVLLGRFAVLTHTKV